jgi:hypothetical protein
MPRYPRRATENVAALEGLEEEAELDCGCLINENLENDTIELWFCTLHETAQRLLDALDLVSTAAYVDRGADAIQCVFCEQISKHDEECPMRLVHEVVREASGEPGPVTDHT